jgi:dimethylargininase
MIAFVREVSPQLERCELSHVGRTAIDLKLARKQHAKFTTELKELGVQIEALAALPDAPDGVFVEDGAIILPEIAVLARPGVASRHPEIDSIAATVARHRRVERIVAPASLDGGDVLRIGRTLFVGISKRTNHEGASALNEIIEAHGYQVRPIEVSGCLHLKTACTFIPPHFLVVNPAWVDPKAFGDLRVMTVNEGEPFAANTLTIGGTTLVSAAFPKTERQLRDAGIMTRLIDVSEFQKAEAGLSCLALFLEPRVTRPPQLPVGFKIVEPADAPSIEKAFAPAVVHGGVAYVSGQLPVHQATGRVVAEDVEAQAEQVLRNLAEILGTSGSSLARVLRLTVYLADPKWADRVTAVCTRAFNGHRPAASIVAAKTLRPGCLIEMDAIAAVSEET